MFPPNARHRSGPCVLRSLKSEAPDCLNSHRGPTQLQNIRFIQLPKHFVKSFPRTSLPTLPKKLQIPTPVTPWQRCHS